MEICLITLIKCARDNRLQLAKVLEFTFLIWRFVIYMRKMLIVFDLDMGGYELIWIWGDTYDTHELWWNTCE